MYPTGSKKNELRPWVKKQWCLPPEASETFVAAMENILEIYQRPQDPAHPVVCVDETSQQHLKDTRDPPAGGLPLTMPASNSNDSILQQMVDIALVNRD